LPEILKKVKQQEIINGLVQLGEIMRAVADEKPFQNFGTISEQQYLQIQTTINRQIHFNGWFTKKSVQFSLLSHGEMLQHDTLTAFTSAYKFNETPKNVAVIMAGNLPLVGFHDFLCVLLSGNKITVKLSSDDQTLLPELVSLLITIDKRFGERIALAKSALKDIDAVIATGSDNTLKYFEEYFGKYPHIFRRNRTSIAVLDGTETKEELFELGKDIFTYFGLGCRNVSHLLLPKNYVLDRFFEGIFEYSDIINHNKYVNNFDYNRAIHLLNQIPFFENGFLILKETNDLHSPLAMLHYHFYENQTDIERYLAENKENIQVVIGKNYVPFGQAQTPNISDFADDVDTMLFLNSLI